MRSSAMMIRVTDEQRRAFEREAAMSGLSTSSWARMKLLETIRKREDEK
jgi:predicted HicB family RNase H-like nuclease